MGRKKTVQVIPKRAVIRCPLCENRMRIDVPTNSIQSLDCTKCSQKITAPITRCCVICAFSNKKCVPSLMMEAKLKGLEIRENTVDNILKE